MPHRTGRPGWTKTTQRVWISWIARGVAITALLGGLWECHLPLRLIMALRQVSNSPQDLALILGGVAGFYVLRQPGWSLRQYILNPQAPTEVHLVTMQLIEPWVILWANIAALRSSQAVLLLIILGFVLTWEGAYLARSRFPRLAVLLTADQRSPMTSIKHWTLSLTLLTMLPLIWIIAPWGYHVGFVAASSTGVWVPLLELIVGDTTAIIWLALGLDANYTVSQRIHTIPWRQMTVTDPVFEGVILMVWMLVERSLGWIGLGVGLAGARGIGVMLQMEYHSRQGTQDWQLAHQAAITDPLTQVLNRRGGLERLANATASGLLATADLDHFKQVNDTYGHDAGDQVLVAAARCLGSTLRHDDVLMRWGGEEFALWVPGLPAAQHQTWLQARVATLAETSIPLDADRNLHVTLSLGGTAWDPAAESFDLAMGRADTALYDAKTHGRNQAHLQ